MNASIKFNHVWSTLKTIPTSFCEKTYKFYFYSSNKGLTKKTIYGDNKGKNAIVVGEGFKLKPNTSQELKFA